MTGVSDHMTPDLYRSVGAEPPKVPPEEAILAYVQAHKSITRREAMTLCHLNERQTEYQIRKLVDA